MEDHGVIGESLCDIFTAEAKGRKCKGMTLKMVVFEPIEIERLFELAEQQLARTKASYYEQKAREN